MLKKGQSSTVVREAKVNAFVKQGQVVLLFLQCDYTQNFLFREYHCIGISCWSGSRFSAVRRSVFKTLR